MTSYLTLGVELAGLVAAIGAILFTVLFMRNPFAPRWTKSNVAAETVSLALVGVFSLAVAVAIKGLVTAGAGFFGAGAVTVGVLAAAACLLWTTLHLGERLRLADSGRSPFIRLGHRTGKQRLGAATH